MEYRLITAPTLEELERETWALLAQGWKRHGGHRIEMTNPDMVYEQSLYRELQ